MLLTEDLNAATGDPELVLADTVVTPLVLSRDQLERQPCPAQQKVWLSCGYCREDSQEFVLRLLLQLPYLVLAAGPQHPPVLLPVVDSAGPGLHLDGMSTSELRHRTEFTLHSNTMVSFCLPPTTESATATVGETVQYSAVTVGSTTIKITHSTRVR